MSRMIFGTLAALVFHCCSAFADVPVEFIDKGMVYPIVVQLDPKVVSGTTFNGFEPGKNTAMFEKKLPLGNTVIKVRNSTFGFPQGVEYLHYRQGKLIWKSGVTVDDKKLVLEEGDELKIAVQQPFLSYNGANVSIPGTDLQGIIVGSRAYWFYFANPGQFPLDAPEPYCNGLFPLADPAIGIKGVSRDLAKKVRADFAKNGKESFHDHRGVHHWSFLHVTDAKGKIPEAFLSVTEDQWAEAFEAAFNNLLQNNCYRLTDMSVETVKELKKEGWLPSDVPDTRPLLLTLGGGVKYAEMYRQKWLDIRQKDTENAKKK